MKNITLFIILFFCQSAFASSIEVDTIAFNFTNSKKETIYGQVILPKHNKSKLPVVIFLVGSAESSFKKNYKGFLKENFENQLLNSGVAICSFDKPGLGLSTGKWYKQTFYDRAFDVNDCINFLSKTPYIDSENIGVVGHSQGGWVAQIVAAQYPSKIKYAISLAGPTYSVKKQLISDFQSSLTCSGIEESKAYKKAVRKTNMVLLLSKCFPFNDNLKQLRKIGFYTPEETIYNIKMPFLFLFGENDRLVYNDWCVKSLDKIFSDKIPTNIQYSVIKGANHSFEMSPFCGDKIKGSLKYSSQFQTELRDYILNMTK